MTRKAGVEEEGRPFLTDDHDGRPTEFLFDVEAYLAMDRLGLFNGRGRVRMLAGKIYRMAPIGSGHGVGQTRLIVALDHLIGRLGLHHGLCAVTATLITGPRDAPEPDAMVVPRLANDRLYAANEAHLVCEVSRSSLREDLGPMKALYANASIAEYWVQDVAGGELHVFRNPSGEDFASRELLKPGDRVSPLFAEGRADIAVADLF